MTVLLQALELYHPMGLTEDWADKMQGQNFYSKNQRTTFEHYMQVSLMSIQAVLIWLLSGQVKSIRTQVHVKFSPCTPPLILHMECAVCAH